MNNAVFAKTADNVRKHVEMLNLSQQKQDETETKMVLKLDLIL